MKSKRDTSRNKKKPVVVAVSGGFDPIHIGHIRMFFAAKELGDKLVVIINNDNWLKKKKGYSFMNEDERKAVIEALKPVDKVIITSHPSNPTDMSVTHVLKILQPDIFANGGDRDKKDAHNKKSSLSPERVLCDKLGIKMVYNVGKGGKLQSSSWLIKKAADETKKKSR